MHNITPALHVCPLKQMQLFFSCISSTTWSLHLPSCLSLEGSPLSLTHAVSLPCTMLSTASSLRPSEMISICTQLLSSIYMLMADFLYLRKSTIWYFDIAVKFISILRFYFHLVLFNISAAIYNLFSFDTEADELEVSVEPCRSRFHLARNTYFLLRASL